MTERGILGRTRTVKCVCRAVFGQPTVSNGEFGSGNGPSERTRRSSSTATRMIASTRAESMSTLVRFIVQCSDQQDRLPSEYPFHERVSPLPRPRRFLRRVQGPIDLAAECDDPDLRDVWAGQGRQRDKDKDDGDDLHEEPGSRQPHLGARPDTERPSGPRV